MEGGWHCISQDFRAAKFHNEVARLGHFREQGPLALHALLNFSGDDEFSDGFLFREGSPCKVPPPTASAPADWAAGSSEVPAFRSPGDDLTGVPATKSPGDDLTDVPATRSPGDDLTAVPTAAEVIAAAAAAASSAAAAVVPKAAPLKVATTVPRRSGVEGSSFIVGLDDGCGTFWVDYGACNFCFPGMAIECLLKLQAHNLTAPFPEEPCKNYNVLAAGFDWGKKTYPEGTQQPPRDPHPQAGRLLKIYAASVLKISAQPPRPPSSRRRQQEVGPSLAP